MDVILNKMIFIGDDNLKYKLIKNQTYYIQIHAYVASTNNSTSVYKLYTSHKSDWILIPVAYCKENFITFEEWRESQLNKVLDGKN